MAVRINASGSFAARIMSQNILHIKRSISIAEMQALFTTPVTLVQAPGANIVALPIMASAYVTSTGHTPYGGGGTVDIGSTADPTMMTLATTAFTNAADKFSESGRIANLTGATASFADLPIIMQAETGNFTGGTGTGVTIELWYILLGK